MEKENQEWEQEKVEEDTLLQLKKSRVGKIDTENYDILEVSNEISDNIQSKVAERGTHNKESTLGNEQKMAEEIEEILRNEAEFVKNGHHHKEENLVFFDHFEGIDLTSTSSGDENPEYGKLEILTQKFDDRNASLSNSDVQPYHISDQGNGESDELSKDLSVGTDQIHVEETEEEIDLDVERVLQTQTTHDLYCPNCYSCITTRVILRKRKRQVRISEEEELKRNKTEITFISNQGSSLVQVPDDEFHLRGLAEVGVEDRDTGPDLFRCLSCFSFFIPSGKSFRLFHIFGDKNKKENVQKEQVPSRKKNLFASMFTSKGQEMAAEQDAKTEKSEICTSDLLNERKINEEVEVGGESHQYVTTVVNSTQIFSEEPAWNTALLSGRKGGTISSNDGPPSLEKSEDEQMMQKGGSDEEIMQLSPTKAPGFKTSDLDGKLNVSEAIPHEHFEAYTSDHLKEPKIKNNVHFTGQSHILVTTILNKTQIISEESTVDTFSLSQRKGGLNLAISSNDGLPLLEELEEGQIIHQIAQKGGSDEEIIQLSPTKALEFKTSDVDKKLDVSEAIPHEKLRAKAFTESTYENFLQINNGQAPADVSKHIIQKTKFEVQRGETLKVDSIFSAKGKDTAITIDTCPVSVLDQVILVPEETSSSIHTTTQIGTAVQERAKKREESKIEVIKSIVYGGLVESITSLSVVSSASGGDAATLNIVALGMANLIGGLFVICHNLWELKCDRIVQASDQVTEQKDRYKELLGRRENFTLHAILCILSYLLFGLMPIAVYGFSFQKSDDKELKLLVVGAASLVCIIVLSIGKAYVCRPPKVYLKTVVNFVILGFTASGISYAAGVLIKRLLDELGLFQSTPVANVFLPGMASKDSSWGSY